MVSVNEYISLFEMYIWLVDVVCNVQNLIKIQIRMCTVDHKMDVKKN